MVGYYSFVGHTVDGQLFNLIVSMNNIKQLAREMKNVAVSDSEVIRLTLYTAKNGVIKPHIIQIDSIEHSKLMEWLTFMLHETV